MRGKYTENQFSIFSTRNALFAAQVFHPQRRLTTSEKTINLAIKTAVKTPHHAGLATTLFDE